MDNDIEDLLCDCEETNQGSKHKLATFKDFFRCNKVMGVLNRGGLAQSAVLSYFIEEVDNKYQLWLSLPPGHVDGEPAPPPAEMIEEIKQHVVKLVQAMQKQAML
jgi:hypothetical protein